MRQGYCSKCHAMIWWGITSKGKWIPLEEDGWAMPNPGGDPMWDEHGNQFKGVATSKIPGAVKLFRPHFLFCPYADQMRKPKKTEYERQRDEKKAEKERERTEAAARKAEKERAAAAQLEFEKAQISLF